MKLAVMVVCTFTAALSQQEFQVNADKPIQSYYSLKHGDSKVGWGSSSIDSFKGVFHCESVLERGDMKTESRVLSTSKYETRAAMFSIKEGKTTKVSFQLLGTDLCISAANCSKNIEFTEDTIFDRQAWIFTRIQRGTLPKGDKVTLLCANSEGVEFAAAIAQSEVTQWIDWDGNAVSALRVTFKIPVNSGSESYIVDRYGRILEGTSYSSETLTLVRDEATARANITAPSRTTRKPVQSSEPKKKTFEASDYLQVLGVGAIKSSVKIPLSVSVPCCGIAIDSAIICASETCYGLARTKSGSTLVLVPGEGVIADGLTMTIESVTPDVITVLCDDMISTISVR